MQPEERIITGQEQDADVWQYSLRPRRLAEYIGQNQVKQNMEVFIKAAADRKEALDHVLLFGPPGLGKTTLANIIANELNVNIRVTSGPAIERQGDLAAILTNLGDNDVLFIDEIHRLSKTVEEILYSAMEDYALDIIIGKGPSARSVRLDLPKFTLIGATTRLGAIAAPLRDRFGVQCRLEFYKPDELQFIITRAAEILGVEIAADGAEEIKCLLTTGCRLRHWLPSGDKWHRPCIFRQSCSACVPLLCAVAWLQQPWHVQLQEMRPATRRGRHHTHECRQWLRNEAENPMRGKNKSS